MLRATLRSCSTLSLAHLLLEPLQRRMQRVRLAPLLDDLAVGYTVDVDAFEPFLRSRRRQAGELAPDHASLRVLGDDRVAFGDLLLDGEAGDSEGVQDLRHRALEVLTGRTLPGNQATVDEVGAEQLVYDIEVPSSELP